MDNARFDLEVQIMLTDLDPQKEKIKKTKLQVVAVFFFLLFNELTNDKTSSWNSSN